MTGKGKIRKEREQIRPLEKKDANISNEKNLMKKGECSHRKKSDETRLQSEDRNQLDLKRALSVYAEAKNSGKGWRKNVQG